MRATADFEIVVDQPMRDEAEVLEGAHVPVEEGHLILAGIEPGEVPSRVHQPQEEHPCLAPLAADIDEHLEEVDLAEVAGLVHERDEHLLSPALPLRDHLPHHAAADGVLSARSSWCRRAAVSRCLPPVQRGASASNCSRRGQTRSLTRLGRSTVARTPGLAPST